MWYSVARVYLFFVNDTATTEIYTLSLHDALPICRRPARSSSPARWRRSWHTWPGRSEEHTSELQSLAYLVCRLLLEKTMISTAHPSNASWNTFLPIHAPNA